MKKLKEREFHQESRREDLNLRPFPYEGTALPAELYRQRVNDTITDGTSFKNYTTERLGFAQKATESVFYSVN